MKRLIHLKKAPEIALEAVKHICGQYKKRKWLRIEVGVYYLAENILSGFVNRFYLFQGLFLAF